MRIILVRTTLDLHFWISRIQPATNQAFFTQLLIIAWFFIVVNTLRVAQQAIFANYILVVNMFSLTEPMHPGVFLKDAYMEPLEMGVTELADKLGVSASSVSRLVSGKSELSYEMAIRLSQVFKRTPEGWMNLQVAYGLFAAKSKLEHA